MKSTKEASKMTITLLLMVFIIWMAIEKSIIGVVTGLVLLFVWVMLVYKLFTDVTLKFRNFLLSLKQKPATTEEVKSQSSVSKQDQDNNQDLVDFQNAADDDVKTMLDDMKRMGFIDSWEVED